MSKEIKVPCQVYIITRQCECGGEMKYEPDYGTAMVYPPRFNHKCTKCGKTESYNITYPRQVYEYNIPKMGNTPTVRDHLRDIANNLLEKNFHQELKKDCSDEDIACVFEEFGTCEVCPLDNNVFKCSAFSCYEDILKYLQKYGDNEATE